MFIVTEYAALSHSWVPPHTAHVPCGYSSIQLFSILMNFFFMCRCMTKRKQNDTCAREPDKVSDQPGRPTSLVRVLAVVKMKR